MRYCLNPDCPKPQNTDKRESCRSCGATLRLKDRYLPIQLIGQGGFGRTFLAIDEDKPSKPRCVIKQFLPITQNPRSLKKAAELFEQEAVRLEELGEHPQIPELLAHFTLNGQQYLVQEFIDGKTLAEILEVHGAFSESQVVTVLSSLLPVLSFIHAHHVIHRDIKPANIISVSGQVTTNQESSEPNWPNLLQVLTTETAQGFRDHGERPYRFSEYLSRSLAQTSPELTAVYQRCQQLAAQFSRYPELSLAQRQYLVADATRLLYELRQHVEPVPSYMPSGHLVLVDFGASKLMTAAALQRTGTTIGSPEYLAPEQARGRAVFASDLYSLGVTCIQLLTNRSPLDLFDPQRGVWIWRKYLKAPLGNPLGQVLDRLLEPSLNRRYTTAAAALADLGPLAEATIPPVSQPSPVNRSPSGGASFLITPKTPPRVSQPPALSSLPTVQKPPPAALPQKSAPLKQSPVSGPGLPAAKVAVAKQAAVREAAPDWQCLHTLVSTGKVVAIATSPVAPILASSSGTTIRLWDLESGQPIRTLTGHLDIIQSLAISPDGRVLVSGSADKSIRLWNLETGQKLGQLLFHTDTVLSLAISPNGSLLASGSLYDPIKLWDLAARQEKGDLFGHTGWVDALSCSPDGQLLASAGTDFLLKLWDLTNRKELRTLKGHTQAVKTVAFSPDSKTLASGSWDGLVKLWSTATGREKRSLQPEAGRINSLAFSPDGKWLATGSDVLQLWSPRTGKELLTLGERTGPISAVAFSLCPSLETRKPRPLLVSASLDGTIKLWQGPS